MKIHSWHLIVGSIVLFLLDFLILANEAIFPNHELKGIATAIVFVCALTFIIGIVWAIFELITKKTKSRQAIATVASPVIASEKSRFALTALEIVFNQIFAVLLVLSSIPLLLNIFALPTIIIFILFSSFLWFGRKYHPVVNILFFIIALGIYFVQIPPIAWGFFSGLKEFRLNNFNSIFPVIFLLPLLIFISFSVRNVLGNILSCFKLSPRRRNLLYLLSLVTVMTTILAYPLLSSIKLRERAMENDDGSSQLSYVLTKQELKIEPGKSGSGSSALARRFYTARFDPVSNKYVYRLDLEDPLSESIVFTAVKIDGEKINFATDGRVQCLNCQKVTDSYGLLFPAGKNIDFIVTSDQMIRVITFIEPGDKAAEFVFWK